MQNPNENLPNVSPVTGISDYRPTPNDPPWNSWIAIAVWGVSVMLVLFVPTLFVLPYIFKQDIDFGDSERLKNFLLTDPTAVILQLVAVILVHGLTLLLAWLVVTKFRTYSFREMLGWHMNGFRVWHAIAITVLFYAVALMLISVLGDVENEFEIMLNSSRYAVYLVAFFATFTAPLVEEVVYRGILYSAFQRTVGVPLAVILVSLLFTGIHVPQYSLSATPDHATVLTILLLSLTLTSLRAATGSLLPCIVLHTVFNGIQSGILIAYPYFKPLEPAIEPTVNIILK